MFFKVKPFITWATLLLLCLTNSLYGFSIIQVSVDLGADTAVCSSITLDAGLEADSFLWSTGETNQTIELSNNSTEVIDTVISVMVNASGCSVSDTIAITLYPTPTLNLGDDISICQADLIDPITLNAGSGFSYLWSTGEITESILVDITDNYSVTITDENNCTAQDEINVSILEWFLLGQDIDGFGEAGRAVSMADENTIATGSPSGDGNGTVRIYDFINDSWIQRGQDILAEEITDGAGRAISMPDDNTVAIGAPFNDNINGEDAGHVRIYKWVNNSWEQQGEDIDGEAVGDFFGFDISMPTPTTIAIGAPLHDIVRGQTKVYDWIENAWVQRGLTLDGEDNNDQSGTSVSMPDANTLAIGAQANDNINGNDAGHTRVYQWIGNQWVQQGEDIDGESEGDASGSRVSMPDANTIAISASNNDENGNDAGHVRIFVWENDTWEQFGEDIDGENSSDRFGFSLSMPDPFTVGIGIRDSRNDNGFIAGRAQIYTWTGTSWEQKGQSIDGEAARDRSGFSVNMPNANTIAIGAPFNNNPNGEGSGQVRVYSFCEEEEITGIKDLFSTNNISNFSLFPNPNFGEFQISSIDNQIIEKVIIYNLRGEVIKEITANSDQVSINLSNESAGSYLVKTISNTEINSSHIVLQK